MIVFGCGSAFCANFEEFLAFVPLVLTVCLSMGFDSLTAVGIIFCAAAAGYGGAITNAFTTGGEILAALAMCGGVSFRKWMKYLLPLFIIWWIVAFVFLGIAVQIGYGPF